MDMIYDELFSKIKIPDFYKVSQSIDREKIENVQEYLVK